MGQQLVGQYPIHFHLAGDLDGQGGYDPPTYVRDLSIHHTFSRCVTVHGSNGLLVSARFLPADEGSGVPSAPLPRPAAPRPEGAGARGAERPQRRSRMTSADSRPRSAVVFTLRPPLFKWATPLSSMNV